MDSAPATAPDPLRVPELEEGARALERGQRRHRAVMQRADKAVERAFHVAETAARK